MKKFIVYIAFLGLLFVSCEKFEPLTQKAGVVKGGDDDNQNNASDTEGNGNKPGDIVIGDGDLDVITDPNNDEDYDNEGKNPNTGQNTPN